MKKVSLLLLLILVLFGCGTSVNETTGEIVKIEHCGEYKTSIVHLDENRAFKLNNSKCKVLNEGAKVELTYDDSFVIVDIKYKENKGDN